MHIRRSELEKAAGPIPLHFPFFSQGIGKESGLLSLSDILFTGEAESTHHLVRLKGELQFSAVLACSRCLTPVEENFRIPIEELFGKRGEVHPAEGKGEVKEKEEEVHWYEGDEIDLIPPLQEWILLTLPPYPLCKPDCKGLCPVCGKNRNEGECGCNPDQTDPRLAGLAKFFEQ